jgi:Sulfatase-modifying factor enzyme 1
MTEARFAFREAARVQRELRKELKRAKRDRQGSSPPLYTICPQSPYRGLQALTNEDAAIFFGREGQVQALANNLLDSHCIFVVGASGSGKSSLVWAGLIPFLSQHSSVFKDDWLWARFTPGRSGDPVRALADALALAGARTSFIVEQDLRRGGHHLSERVSALLSNTSKKKLLIFADQFEELFTLVHDRNQRKTFVEVLGQLMAIETVYVVGTIRAEFLHPCTESEEFDERVADWLNRGTYWLTAPNEDDLRSIIIRPAQKVGAFFQEGLVDTLIADTGVKAGSLALLAFALKRLFDARSAEGMMMLEHYQAFGGVEGAIADHASHVYATLFARLGQEADAVMEYIFRELIEVDEDTGQAVRRRVPVTFFSQRSELKVFIDTFVDARLLVSGSNDRADLSGIGEITLEVAHEALFRAWPKLKFWIDAHRDCFVLRRRLQRDAREWEQNGRAKAYSWSDELAIAAAPMIKRIKYNPSNLEKQFLGPVEYDEMSLALSCSETSHGERAAIGVRFALAGDARKGVGLTPCGLPEISWCDVSRGKVLLPDDSTLLVEAFKIAQYPITASQYKTFAEARDGYRQKCWWAELHREYEGPGGQFPNYSNHPAVNILWSEAMAFCRWLTCKIGSEIRLPSEWEWQLAATGGNPSFRYPWGPEWKINCANIDETSLDRPIAVGCYPQGRSPVGALDMIGTVWEWCLNAFDDQPSNVDIKHPGDRSVRGGSWNSRREDANNYKRGHYYLGYRNLNTGFRVASSMSSFGVHSSS